MDDTQTQQTDSQEDVIASAEDLAEEISVQQAPTGNKAVDILQLENLINGYLADLEQLQKQYKEQSQMFRDALENDAEYASCVAKAREISKEKKTIQDKLIQDPSLALIDSKIKDLKADMKETTQALSDYLHKFYQESGLRQITGTDGEIREIVTHVKLVKKKE